MSKHIRELLKKNTAFNWLEDHKKEFTRMKNILTGDRVVKPFDPMKHSTLVTDASRLHGIGYALMQKDSDGKLKLITSGSRSLTGAVSRYSTIKLECLGISYTLRKTDYYLRGQNNETVLTDHKPLVGIFNKPLQGVENPRLLRLREKLSA